MKAISEKGSGHSPLQGIATPFPAGTRDYVQDNSFSSVAGSAPWDRASHIQPKFEAGWEVVQRSRAEMISHVLHWEKRAVTSHGPLVTPCDSDRAYHFEGCVRKSFSILEVLLYSLHGTFITIYLQTVDGDSAQPMKTLQAYTPVLPAHSFFPQTLPPR